MHGNTAAIVWKDGSSVHGSTSSGGTWQLNESFGTMGSGRYPQVVVTDNELPVAAWDGASSVEYRVYIAGSWTFWPVATVKANSTKFDMTKVKGGAALIWSANNTDIHAAYMPSDSNAFGAPINVNSTSGSTDGPSAVVGNDRGDLLVYWYASTSSVYHLFATAASVVGSDLFWSNFVTDPLTSCTDNMRSFMTIDGAGNGMFGCNNYTNKYVGSLLRFQKGVGFTPLENPLPPVQAPSNHISVYQAFTAADGRTHLIFKEYLSVSTHILYKRTYE